MRKFILLLCIAFVVLCYGYPCFVLPFGEYKGEINIMQVKQEISYKFNFNGKVKVKVSESENEYYYKIKGNNLIISTDKNFNDLDSEYEITSIYKVNGLTNKIGLYITIGIGALATILVLSAKMKK